MDKFRILAIWFCSISVLSGCENTGGGSGDSSASDDAYQEPSSIQTLSTQAGNNVVCIPILAKCGCQHGSPIPEDSCDRIDEVCEILGTGPADCNEFGYCECDIIVFLPD